MGVNHGATLIYGYKYQQHKTFEDIPSELTDKAHTDYPGGREIMEKLWNEYSNFNYTESDAISGSGSYAAGIEIADRYSIGMENITMEELEKARRKLSDELDQKIKAVAEIDEDEEPGFILVSRLG